MANVNSSHLPSSMLKYDLATLTIARVDEEIARREHELCDLRSYRNSMTPIFRLPSETLQAIFTCLVHDFHDQSIGAAHSTVPLWVNVSYVCRHWRAVALNCSTLWSYLFILSPRWTEELLARSDQASLKVNVKFGPDRSSRAPCFLRQVTEHAERIRELYIRLPTHGRVDLSVLSSRAPRLTSLTIFGTHRSSELNWPSVLFDGDIPMLRTLHLSCCPISWYSLEVTGLTSLTLSRVPHQLRQTTEDFLATLRCMPGLIHLDIYDAFSGSAGFLSSAAFETFQKICLPHLSRLGIYGPIPTVIALLHCLDVPRQTLVRLEFGSEPGLSLDDHAPLSSLLAQRFNTSDTQAPSSPIIRSLDIEFMHESATLTFNVLEHGRNITASQADGTWDHNLPLEIVINFDELTTTDHDRSTSDSFISDLCCSIPLTNVRRLYVFRPPSSTAFWSKTLGHLRDVRHLKLERGRMPDLTPLLSVGNGEIQGGFTGPGPDRECAPALEMLQLCQISFRPPKHASPNAPCLTDVRSLYDALSRRKKSDGQLVMHRCIVAKDYIMKFDMAGRWEGGHFRVVEEHARPHRYAVAQSDSESEDLEESDDSEERRDPEESEEESTSGSLEDN